MVSFKEFDDMIQGIKRHIPGVQITEKDYKREMWGIAHSGSIQRQTQMSLVNPFLTALGFDIDDPLMTSICYIREEGDNGEDIVQDYTYITNGDFRYIVRTISACELLRWDDLNDWIHLAEAEALSFLIYTNGIDYQVVDVSTKARWVFSLNALNHLTAEDYAMWRSISDEANHTTTALFRHTAQVWSELSDQIQHALEQDILDASSEFLTYIRSRISSDITPSMLFNIRNYWEGSNTVSPLSSEKTDVLVTPVKTYADIRGNRRIIGDQRTVSVEELVTPSNVELPPVQRKVETLFDKSLIPYLPLPKDLSIGKADTENIFVGTMLVNLMSLPDNIEDDKDSQVVALQMNASLCNCPDWKYLLPQWVEKIQGQCKDSYKKVFECMEQTPVLFDCFTTDEAIAEEWFRQTDSRVYRVGEFYYNELAAPAYPVKALKDFLTECGVIDVSLTLLYIKLSDKTNFNP